VRELAKAQLRTEQALERLTGRLEELGARVDRMAEVAIRGLTPTQWHFPPRHECPG
jgi:hypothetical protein